MHWTPEQSWQNVIEALKYFDDGNLRWSHVPPLGELAERLAPAALELRLFAGKSHESLIISKGNIALCGSTRYPMVLIQPRPDGTLTFGYTVKSHAKAEVFTCPFAEGEEWIEHYMARILRDSNATEQAGNPAPPSC